MSRRVDLAIQGSVVVVLTLQKLSIVRNAPMSKDLSSDGVSLPRGEGGETAPAATIRAKLVDCFPHLEAKFVIERERYRESFKAMTDAVRTTTQIGEDFTNDASY